MLEKDSSVFSSHSNESHISWVIPALVLTALAWFGWIWINKSQTQNTQKLNLDQKKLRVKDLGTINQNLKSGLALNKLEQIAMVESARAAIAPQALAQQSASSAPKLAKNQPASLLIKNVSGKIVFSGAVTDQISKDLIISTINNIFGTTNVNGDLLIDEHLTSPRWVNKINLVIRELDTPGIELSMKGDSIKISGTLPRASLNSLMLKIQGSLGQGFSIAAEPDTNDKIVS